MNRKAVYGLMVMTTFFWSGAFIAGKFSVPHIPVCTLTFLRFFFAVIVMTILVKAFGAGKENGEKTFKLTKDRLPFFVVTGIVGMIGYHVLFFTSLKYTTAINSSIINAMNPIITVIMSSIILRSRFSAKQIAGIILSFIGVVLTITGADFGAFSSMSLNKGDFIMTGAMLCWAAYGVYSKLKGKGIPAFWLTYYTFISCLIFITPLVLLEKPWTFLGQIPWTAWAAVLYMSIFASVIGYMMQQVSIKEIGPSRTSIFINLVPVFSMILAVAILGEQLLPVKIFTAMLIIAGVIICQTAGEKQKG